MQILGQLLLWSGCLGAAFASVSRLEVTDDKWSTIPWTHYGIWLVICATGAILLRINKSQTAQESDRVIGQYSTLRTSLNKLLDSVSELRGSLGELVPRDIVASIDDLCAEPFSDFAEARNALVQRFGLEAFANVMTQFASGERFVNRAWSAAADGYVDEVAASLERAELHLQKADQLMVELEQEHG